MDHFGVGFDRALGALKLGSNARRSSWPRGKYLRLAVPPKRASTRPFFSIENEMGQAPWSPTHEDLLATDWGFCNENEGSLSDCTSVDSGAPVNRHADDN